MKKDLSFRAFLRATVRFMRDIFRGYKKREDPFLCAMFETFAFNAPLALLLWWLHPLTVCFTIPWIVIRLIYWCWVDLNIR